MQKIISNKKYGLFLRKKVRPFAPFFRFYKRRYSGNFRGIELYVGGYFLHLVYIRTHRR